MRLKIFLPGVITFCIDRSSKMLVRVPLVERGVAGDTWGVLAVACGGSWRWGWSASFRYYSGMPRQEFRELQLCLREGRGSGLALLTRRQADC